MAGHCVAPRFGLIKSRGHAALRDAQLFKIGSAAKDRPSCHTVKKLNPQRSLYLHGTWDTIALRRLSP